MRGTGLEPIPLSGPGPKPGASANSATLARLFGVRRIQYIRRQSPRASVFRSQRRRKAPGCRPSGKRMLPVMILWANMLSGRSIGPAWRLADTAPGSGGRSYQPATVTGWPVRAQSVGTPCDSCLTAVHRRRLPAESASGERPCRWSGSQRARRPSKECDHGD